MIIAKYTPEKTRRIRNNFAEPLEPRELLSAQNAVVPGGEMEAAQALVGDMNDDQQVDQLDVGPFEMALANPEAFLARYPWVLDYVRRGDVNGDRSFDNFDIEAFSLLVALTDPGAHLGATTAANAAIQAVSIAAVAVQPGVWISPDQIRSLPTTGAAWLKLTQSAAKTTTTPDLSNQDEDADVFTLAKALVGVRQNNATYLAQVRQNVMAAIGTEAGGRTLALGRNLASYVIAADLVGLSPTDDARFRTWLRTTLSENLDGDTLRSTHELRANNWGTMAGGSRAAVAVYLGDTVELARVAKVFKGWLGDRASYAGFKFGDTAWQADPKAPVGINPLGSTKGGHSIDGALPEEMRRGGPFAWPPKYTNYPWGALQGVVVQAEILYRAGYDTWQWSDKAILRAVQYLYNIGWAATSDDQWIISLINARYGSTFTANAKASPGKIMGWTAWTHQQSASAIAAAAAVSVSEVPVVTLSVTMEESIDQVAPATAAAPDSIAASSSAAVRASNPQAGQAASVAALSRSRLQKAAVEDALPVALDGVLCELEPLAAVDPRADQR